MPTNEPKPTKAVRRDEARLKALALREQQKKRDRRNRIVAISGLVAALAVLAVVVVIILGQGKSTTSVAFSGTPPTISDSNPPSTSNPDGGIPVGTTGAAGTSSPDGAVKVDIYLDYMCPVCGDFEKVNGASLTALREKGDITIVYHPVSILDRYSQSTEYSTRAANAVAIVADAAPEAYEAFHEALFANQPTENTAGLTDAKIAELATGAGVPQTVADTFTQKADGKDWLSRAPFVAALTAQSTSDLNALGQQMQTPTILLNGKLLDTNTYNWQVDGQLAAAIAAAKG